MLCISIGQTGPVDSDEEFREFLELDLEDVLVAVNLINSDEKVKMISWDLIHRDGMRLCPTHRANSMANTWSPS